MNPIKEKFGVKVFVALTIFIFIISFSFTAFYIHDQKQSLTGRLIKNGKLLAGILANTSRIGVFSENERLLKDAAKGIFHHGGVLKVAIFNSEGELLHTRKKTGKGKYRKSVNAETNLGKSIFEKIRTNKSSSYQEVNGILEFWSPVMSDSGYFMEEPLFFQADTVRQKARIIGFVKITMDKEMLSRRINDLLFKSLLMGILFLLIGSGGTYLVVNRITKPLNRLTNSVKIIGSGGMVEEVPVETDDEIGKLARAFNNMSESLKKREEALKESAKRLRSLSSRLIEAQEQERRRISKGLHDELGQALALLKHRIRAIKKQSQTQLQKECHDVILYIDQIIENVRRLSKDLSPSILEDLGLSAAIEWLIKNFEKQYAIQTSVDMVNIDQLFSIETQTNLYRIFQEALTNIGKHAQATQAAFHVKEEKDHILFIIKNDGKGFDVNEAITKSVTERGMGLAAMNERAHMLGAKLEIMSRTGSGTTISLKIPV